MKLENPYISISNTKKKSQTITLENEDNLNVI